MRVEIGRRPDGGTHATYERDDGVRLRLRSFDRTWSMPHDAMHLVVERALGMTEGLWGSLAAGAVFDSVEWVSGRQRHDRRRRSDDVRRRHADQLRLAEVVVGVLGAQVDADPDTALRELAGGWGITRADPCPFTREQVSEALVGLRELRDRWASDEDPLVYDWPGPRAVRARSTTPRSAGRRRR